MQPIDLGGHIGQEQFQLSKEGEVVRGNVGVRAAADIVLCKPVGVQRAQDAQHVQVRPGVENVVDHTLGTEEEEFSAAGTGDVFSTTSINRLYYLEVEGVIGVRHQAVLVGALQLEAVGDPAVGQAVLAVAVEFGQAVAVAELLEVLVCAVHAASTQVLHHA